MSFKSFQEQTDAFTAQFIPQYWQPHEILTRLMEEVGELAREVNHIYGPKKKKSSEQIKELKDELADILFTLCCFANSQKIDLDSAWKEMMDKYNTRDKDRFKRKTEIEN